MKPIALIVLLGLLKQASGQIEVIWDRTYGHMTGITTPNVVMSSSGRILLVGATTGSSTSATYRVVDSSGDLWFNTAITNNGRQVRMAPISSLTNERAVLYCEACPVSTFVAGRRLYWATESSLGEHIGPPDAPGYFFPFQVQWDDSVAAIRPHTSLGGRQGWSADLWRWGGSRPVWVSEVFPIAGSEPNRAFFPSNMLNNTTDRITPVGWLGTSMSYFRPFWFSLASSGSLLWEQTVNFVSPSIPYVMADDGSQYLLLHDTSVRTTWVIKCDANGALQWSVDVGHTYPYLETVLTVDHRGDLWFLRMPDDGYREWVILNGSDGTYRAITYLHTPDGRNGRPHRCFIDPLGSVYVSWSTYDGTFLGGETNHRSWLTKHDENGEPIWTVGPPEIDLPAAPRVLKGFEFVSVVTGAQRIIKFRIRAAFIEGDASGDGCIDDKDLAMTLEAFGTSDPTADFDSNGIVDDRDLERVLRNFGLGCAD